MSAPHVFTRFAVQERPDGVLGELTDLLAEGVLDRPRYDALTATVDDTERAAFDDGRLDLLLYVARDFLADHSLDANEAQTLRELTILLRVREGEFTQRRSGPLGRLLRTEMGRIAADGLLDWTEEAYLAALQAAFRLGYDEFLALACGDLTTDQRRALRLP